MVFLLVYGATVATQNELEVTVKPIEGLGMGAFAAEPAEAGRWVCAYHGKLVTKEDVELRYPDEPPKYLFELDDTYSLDAQDSELEISIGGEQLQTAICLDWIYGYDLAIHFHFANLKRSPPRGLLVIGHVSMLD